MFTIFIDVLLYIFSYVGHSTILYITSYFLLYFTITIISCDTDMYYLYICINAGR